MCSSYRFDSLTSSLQNLFFNNLVSSVAQRWEVEGTSSGWQTNAGETIGKFVLKNPYYWRGSLVEMNIRYLEKS